ncbi:MAG: hypothetical protein NTW30_06290 [Candidatus Aenigmarchaeota archaeon]|nr:hypothetical protein [Candidatus Aenigmarchaeota archaeon]
MANCSVCQVLEETLCQILEKAKHSIDYPNDLLNAMKSIHKIAAAAVLHNLVNHCPS